MEILKTEICLYGVPFMQREDNEDQFDLSHAFDQTQLVDDAYPFSKNVSFDGITFELDNSDTLESGHKSNNGYLQLYANFENANAES